MKQPKVSIIVPIYNMASYLARCLDSLLAQSLRDIEIIAVNDGSTDESLSILQQYEQRDSRITVIDKVNGGVSSARNAGLGYTNGEYIGFVDPDDWVDINMYQALHETASREDADIVMCGYVREFGTHSKEKKYDLPDKVTYDNLAVQSIVLRRLIGPQGEEIAHPEQLDAWGTVWSKLYRAKLLKAHDVRFVDLTLIGSNEDTLFNIQTFYNATSFVFINKPYYHYWRVNEQSITAKHNAALFDQFLELYDMIEQFINKKGLHEGYYTALCNRVCFNVLGLGLNTIKKSNDASFFKKIRALNKMLRDERMKQSFYQFDMSYSPMPWKAFFLCAKLRLSWGLYAMLVIIEWLRKHKR